MVNRNQAPILSHTGNKNGNEYNNWGKAIRTHELECAIANGLDGRDFVAYKVMMFLTGNADGFAIAEKTICDRCNISEKNYKVARKKLAEKGWIDFFPGKEIKVNYDKIYADYAAKMN